MLAVEKKTQNIMTVRKTLQSGLSHILNTMCKFGTLISKEI